MVFKFFKLNSINKSYSYLSSISSKPHKNSIFTLQNPSKIQPLTTQNPKTFKSFHFDHSKHDNRSKISSKSHKNSSFTLQILSTTGIHHPTNSQTFKSFHFDHDNCSKITSKHHKNSNFTLQNGSTIQTLTALYNVILTNPPNSQTFKRGHFGHSHHDHGFSYSSEQSKKNENIFRLGLAADVGLTIGKAITGYLSGSTAIIADAAHSLSDVVLSGVALLSYKAARVPRDKEHPYGHGKFETLGALGISGMLLVTAGGIAWHAADILLGLYTAAPETVMQSSVNQHEHHHGGHSHEIDMSHPFLALSMAIISIGVKEGLFWMTKKAGDKEGSGLMKANAWHHRADAISSFVALIGEGPF
ncbi:hypothetical protein RND81_04G080900 [Saponaria officinalis]|uniref:Cation efflux protein transmembrane domain-containing protein n=1 Tax=Saponaria officinalis TaxID=3572 RepID=A0AAW1LDL0_SAPOF